MGHGSGEPLKCESHRIAVITFSDTRSEIDDHSGRAIMQLLTNAGHEILSYGIVREDSEKIADALQSVLDSDAEIIITSGGTGISARDSTIEVAKRLMNKELPGFGETFRFLSFQQIGSAAILSRATAGVARGKFVACLPGSTKAVTLALKRILLPELSHILWEISRQA